MKLLITPEMAKRWLEQSNDHNRPISQAHCERLARDMREGRWKLTHEGIAFSANGRLVDGQHRLASILLAGRSIEMFVWLDVSAETLMTINNGRPRDLVDLLSLSGAAKGIDGNDVAILRAMLGGMGKVPNMTAAEAADAYHRHKEAIEFATVYLVRRGGINGVATSDIRAVIARAYYSVDLERLATFCQVLSCGVATSPEDRPAVLLFAHLVRNPGNTELARHDRYARTQRALVAFIRGENLNRLMAVSTEQFPLPNEK